MPGRTWWSETQPAPPTPSRIDSTYAAPRLPQQPAADCCRRRLFSLRTCARACLRLCCVCLPRRKPEVKLLVVSSPAHAFRPRAPWNGSWSLKVVHMLQVTREPYWKLLPGHMHATTSTFRALTAVPRHSHHLRPSEIVTRSSPDHGEAYVGCAERGHQGADHR